MTGAIPCESMPNSLAIGYCPVYGLEGHKYNIHYGANSGFTDTAAHTYVYYQSGNQLFYSSCTFQQYHQYYYAMCACNTVNYGSSCEHVYMERHPGTAPNQPNGCASGDVYLSLPNHLY